MLKSSYCRFVPVLVAVLGIAVLPLTGCKKNSNTASDSPLNLVAVDRSGSTETMRKQQIVLLGTALVAAQERDERFGIWVVDRKVAPVFMPQKVHLGNQLPPGILSELRTPSKNRATRTRPSVFWEEAARKFGGSVPMSGKETVRIVYLTDGGNDWAGEETRISKAITTLAENPHVNVAVIGVDKDLISPMEEQFAPMGKRFLLRGRDSETADIDAWRKGSTKE